MKCQFCQQDATFAPLDEMKDYGVDVYFCHTCQAEYLVFQKTNFINSVSLYTTINKKMYRVTNIQNTLVQLWYIKNPGIPGTRKNTDLSLIASFKEDLPKVTPLNIKDKVRTLLVFS
jgi:hypothetical protein